MSSSLQKHLSENSEVRLKVNVPGLEFRQSDRKSMVAVTMKAGDQVVIRSVEQPNRRLTIAPEAGVRYQLKKIYEKLEEVEQVIEIAMRVPHSYLSKNPRLPYDSLPYEKHQDVILNRVFEFKNLGTIVSLPKGTKIQ